MLVCTQVGVINASVATCLAIQKYHPKIIISQGIAGGYGESVHQRDLVIGTEVLNNNTYYTPKNKEGVNYNEYKLVDFDQEEWYVLPLVKANEELVEKAKMVDYPHGNVHIGRIGSGDIWNNEKERIHFLMNTHHILCEEMEGYAIGKIASNYQIPFLAVRVISNNAILQEKYDTTVGTFTQEFVMNLIEKC